MDRGGNTPLLLASHRGSNGVVQILLEFKANVKHRNNEGNSALHLAASKGHDAVLRTLCEYYAEVNERNNSGCTPLHEALLFDDSVAILLELGADVTLTDDNGNTPLKKAVDGLESPDTEKAAKFKKTAEVLVKHMAKIMASGADVNVTDRELLTENQEISPFLNDSELELNVMKDRYIEGSTISFFDILIKSTSTVSVYVRNEDLLRVLQSSNLEDFPIYASAIESQIRMGKERRDLMTGGSEYFNLLNDILRLSKALPYICIEKICSYLKNKDLQNLIQAKLSVAD